MRRPLRESTAGGRTRSRNPSRTRSRTRITLSEDDGVRYLHFGTQWVQGGMRIARPFKLELAYQQQMMALALFVEAPQRILQLGLGAAALTKYCWRTLTEAHVTAVELNGEVIDAAHRWFALPPDNERLAVIKDDARDYLANLPRGSRADWLQVDLYDAAARGPVYDDEGFYTMCRGALRRGGVACFNLFGSRFDPSFLAICRAFGDRVLAGPEVDEGNRVVYALTGPRIDLPGEVFARRAARLEAAWRLPFRRWWQDLQRGNDLGNRVRL